ncbi:hypothetical protein ABAC460_20525 [Asticcacaulis sp. AC460]|nr:hypothetical protein ABAC460_20525 [Asticcacaulis sp. AC460]
MPTDLIREDLNIMSDSEMEPLSSMEDLLASSDEAQFPIPMR